jgi:hypothetical protein
MAGQRLGLGRGLTHNPIFVELPSFAVSEPQFSAMHMFSAATKVCRAVQSSATPKTFLSLAISTL